MAETQKTFAKEAIRTMQKDIELIKSRETAGQVEFEELTDQEKDQKFLEKLEQIWLQKHQKKEPIKIVTTQPQIVSKSAAKEAKEKESGIYCSPCACSYVSSYTYTCTCTCTCSCICSCACCS